MFPFLPAQTALSSFYTTVYIHNLWCFSKFLPIPFNQFLFRIWPFPKTPILLRSLMDVSPSLHLSGSLPFKACQNHPSDFAGVLCITQWKQIHSLLLPTVSKYNDCNKIILDIFSNNASNLKLACILINLVHYFLVVTSNSTEFGSHIGGIVCKDGFAGPNSFPPQRHT